MARTARHGVLAPCLCTALLGALFIVHRAAHAAKNPVHEELQRRPLPTYQGVASLEAGGVLPPNRAQSSPTRLPVGEENRARLTAEFNAARVVQRQAAVFDRECGCTKLILQQQAQLHASLERVTVLDGSHFRWEGLGNSGVRWMGLMRWALSTGRATYLRLTQGCAGAERKQAHSPSSGRPIDATCHLDPGDYFTGWGGVDWGWRAATERRVAEAMALRGEEELLLQYECVTRQAPGCGVAALRFSNGSRVVLREPDEMLHFFRTTPHRHARPLHPDPKRQPGPQNPTPTPVLTLTLNPNPDSQPFPSALTPTRTTHPSQVHPAQAAPAGDPRALVLQARVPPRRAAAHDLPRRGRAQLHLARARAQVRDVRPHAAPPAADARAAARAAPP